MFTPTTCKDAPEWCPVVPKFTRQGVPFGAVLVLIPPVAFVVGFVGALVMR